MSRQNTYLLLTTLFMLIFVFSFSYYLLIPSGKSFRAAKEQVQKIRLYTHELQGDFDALHEQYERLKSDHKPTLMALRKSFDPSGFVAQNSRFFNSLEILEVQDPQQDQSYTIYEITTTSDIDSPQNFYDFIENINSSDWVIEVNFPIHFKREASTIKSSFSMKVYNALN